MELLIALLPGTFTGLFVFGTLVALTGRYCGRRFQHGWKLFTGYLLLICLLWIVCVIAGAALFWPFMKHYGHAALVMFFMPYFIVTCTVAAVALMKYGSEMLAHQSQKATVLVA